MPFLKKIDQALEKIEKIKIHLSGTTLGLFFIGLVLLLGLYFTSSEFHNFTTLTIKTGEFTCQKYTGRPGPGVTSTCDKNVQVNWLLLSFVAGGATWVAIRKGWMKKLFRWFVSAVSVGWREFSKPYDR